VRWANGQPIPMQRPAQLQSKLADGDFFRSLLEQVLWGLSRNIARPNILAADEPQPVNARVTRHHRA
jgi:hypothetical protein